MSAQSAVSRRFDDRELAVRSQLEVWEGQNKRLGELLYQLSDEQLTAPLPAGKNSGVYIVGHLAAVNDGLLPLLGFGDKRFPYLEDAFLKEPEHGAAPAAAAGEVRRAWADLLGVLRDNFAQLTPDDWFDKHAAATDEDFADEPLRSKINVLINGTNHITHHLGQLRLLTQKGGN